MKTTVIKKQDITRKWYLVDAKDKVVGRIATTIADRLRGKNKAIFSSHMDCGDFVVVINAEKIKLTGKKLENKIYYRHTGFPGGIVAPKAGEVLEKKTTKILELAVRGMLPRNKLRDGFMKKLKLYAGVSHPHTAQNPIILEV